jgi:hypothetical protein
VSAGFGAHATHVASVSKRACDTVSDGLLRGRAFQLTSREHPRGLRSGSPPGPPYVLPLVFAASTGVTAGSYRVEASATGYTAKSVDGVSIATANQTGVNFTLAP